jgi:hypothetical protein
MKTFVLAAALLAASAAYARGPSKLTNPVVLAPKNGTYKAGEEMEIVWANATTGFVNIQVDNDYPEVLGGNRYTVALGVPASLNRFVWKIPRDLRSAAGYHMNVWGVAPPSDLEKAGNTEGFTILNQLKDSVTTFKVLTPNAKQPCATNAPCVITWDYPKHMEGERPAEVHLRLFQGHNLKPSLVIATNIPADQKTYTWNVPNDASLLSKDMYISVNAEAVPPAGPGLGDNMGGNGQVFNLDSVLPQPELDEEAMSAADHKSSESGSVEIVTETVTEMIRRTQTGKPEKQDKNAGSAVAPALPAAALLLAIVPLALFL